MAASTVSLPGFVEAYEGYEGFVQVWECYLAGEDFRALNFVMVTAGADAGAATDTVTGQMRSSD